MKTKIRNGFGVDPGNGQVARQEGGILVALPGADGPYYNGTGESRWILPGGSRDDAHRPHQVVHGLYPVPNVPVQTNSRLAGADEDVYVTPGISSSRIMQVITGFSRCCGRTG